MKRKILDQFLWKEIALHQSSDNQTAILVCSQTDDASWLDCQQAEGHTFSTDEEYILSVVEGWLTNG